MKYLNLFEDFKQKNITLEDIVRCIESGGVIYATTIRNFPNNNPDLPLNPLSVDKEGTITVEFEGRNYEVEIRHVDKIEWNPIRESLQITDDLSNVIYTISKKNDKVADLLVTLINRDEYATDEDLNFIKVGESENLITYYPPNKRKTYNFMNTTQGVSIRIGRAVRKIIETVKPSLSLDKDVEAEVFSIKPSDRDLNKLYVIKIKRDYIFLYSRKIHETLEISTDRFSILGKIISYNKRSENDIFVIESDIEVKGLVMLTHWTQAVRNFDNEVPTKIKILPTTPFTDSDIEKFVNEYISFVKMTKSDESSKILEVRGDDIIKWYSMRNYQSLVGNLGNSCMAYDDCGAYLEFYADCPSVSLLILTNKENKLVGRALLWKLDDGRMFMDRVYTSFDYDQNIFFNYAIENGYMYRTSQTIDYKFMIDSKEINPGIMIVTIRFANYYPFLDTIIHYDSKNQKLSNYKQYDKTLQDTGGKWLEYYEDED
jgi:hypothetical protein